MLDTHDSVDFLWAGSDEGVQAKGDGALERLDDGTIEIKFACDNGDGAVLRG